MTGSRRRRRRSRLRLRLVGPAGRRRMPFLLAAFLAIGSLVVAVVTLQALVAQGSFRMQELARKNGELSQSAGRLQLQIAQLSAPDRIAGQARRLGYRLPDPAELHTITVRSATRDGAAGARLDDTLPSVERQLGAKP